VNYYACVGFSVRDAADVARLAERAVREGRALRTDPGLGLRRWQLGGGVELWAEVGPGGEPLGVLPFFQPQVEHRAAVVASSPDPGNPEEGWAEMWLDPTDPEEPYTGSFPLVCDLVDYLAVAGHLRDLPLVTDVQVVGFAHELRAYRDALDWAATQQRTGFRLPLQTLASTAHTALDDTNPDRPEATAMVAGVVREVEALENPLTHARFWSLRVDVGGTDVPLVVPEELSHGLEAGHLVQAAAWMLARLPALEAPEGR
jgi:hypothetical protein